MNLKYVVLAVVAMLLAVSELAQPGGAIDTVSQEDGAAQAAKPRPSSATSEFTDDAWEDTPDFASSDYSSEEAPQPAATQQASIAPMAAPSQLDPERGAIPLEKQGLELPSPTGVMPSRWGF